MKKVLLAAMIILYAAGGYAQIGMPKELTCTERALNFSFSLGTKWKISTPKMGPAEVTREEPDYFPFWSLKHNEVTPEAYLLSLFEMPFNVETIGHSINQKNYTALSYHNSFRVMDKPRYLFPGINFSSPIIYKILKPDFLVNSISYNQ